MTDIPEHIMEEARDLARRSIYHGGVDWATEDISKALRAAEQRGREEEREECALLCESQPWHVDISPDHIMTRRPVDYAESIRSRTPEGQ